MNPGKAVRIFLVRHAQSKTVDEEGRIRNIPGLGLTEEGVQQANATAEFLKDSGIEIVYSSDTPRAQQTAEIIASKAGAEVKTFEWLREFSIGELEGAPFWEHMDVIREILSPSRINPDEKFPGGESINDLVQRVMPNLKELLKNSPSKICIVAHGGVNRVIITSLLNLPVHFFTSIDQENACVNIIDVENERAMLRMLNYVPYDGVKKRIEVSTLITL